MIQRLLIITCELFYGFVMLYGIVIIFSYVNRIIYKCAYAIKYKCFNTYLYHIIEIS